MHSVQVIINNATPPPTAEEGGNGTVNSFPAPCEDAIESSSAVSITQEEDAVASAAVVSVPKEEDTARSMPCVSLRLPPGDMCLMCRTSLFGKDVIRTTCSHYFCQGCVPVHPPPSPSARCATCGAQLQISKQYENFVNERLHNDVSREAMGSKNYFRAQKRIAKNKKKRLRRQKKQAEAEARSYADNA